MAGRGRLTNGRRGCREAAVRSSGGRKLGLEAAGEARTLSVVVWSKYVCPEAHWESRGEGQVRIGEAEGAGAPEKAPRGQGRAAGDFRRPEGGKRAE